MRVFGNIINNALKYSDGDLLIRLEEDGEVSFSNHARELDEVEAGKLFPEILHGAEWKGIHRSWTFDCNGLWWNRWEERSGPGRKRSGLP